MSEGVFRVSMVVGRGDDAVAELFGCAAGVDFPMSDPVKVPAEVLAAVAGVAVVDLPDRAFVSSASGWVPADTMV